MALASVYYFLPKIIGRPVQSYNLSLLGFWTLAFFYGQVGGHHLIGGPIPGWLVTLSIVQSMMMIVPVISFSINQHLTMRGYFSKLIYSPTLRFIVLGGMMYTLSSIQGSIEALRSVNTVAHFTHFTVAHAHLGLYGFFTMVMFGAVYFVMPRVMAWEWPYPKLISAHFWLVVIGFGIYFVGLTIGGWLQGLAMLDASKPFMDSVKVTIPYLHRRRRHDPGSPGLRRPLCRHGLALWPTPRRRRAAAHPQTRHITGQQPRRSLICKTKSNSLAAPW
jgi:cytochrome c oxidase cbb3-type subunit 1